MIRGQYARVSSAGRSPIVAYQGEDLHEAPKGEKDGEEHLG